MWGGALEVEVSINCSICSQLCLIQTGDSESTEGSTEYKQTERNVKGRPYSFDTVPYTHC
jgi:hypothetical protein